MKKQKAYIIPHTHWDREWRYPIWKNRALLVKFMDQLLETLENDERYRYFHLDGQAIIVEDYLQIRPEKKDIVQKHVQNGRLGIGPWYTLPDLYPVNAECLIRNIKKGMEVSEKYGGYVKIGYHSFGWGQISQFPQIYKNLGFDLLFAGKKVSKKRAPKSEFLWEGPDGSTIFTSRFGEHSRANVFFNAYIQIKNGMDYFSEEFQYKWGLSKPAIHDAAPEKQSNDFFVTDSQNETWYPEHIQKGFQKAWDAYSQTNYPDKRLLMNGSDFSTCQPFLPDIIEKANQQFKDIEFVHANFVEYYEAIKDDINLDELTLVKGELRDEASSDSSANALATRVYIKLLNKKAENLLLYKAEPLAAMLMIDGELYPESFINLAWEYLLKSHAHDSINGVTQDKTANDVEYHLNQAIELSETIIEQSVAALVNKIDFSGFAKEDILLLCVNTHPYETSDIAKVVVDIPRDRNIWDFTFADEAGNALEVQSIHRKERTTAVHDLENRALPLYHDRHEVYVETGKLPAGGYKTLKLVPKNTFPREGEWWPVVRKSKGDEISMSPGEMENEFLKISLHPEGTISVKDKETGYQSPPMHYFTDEGDMGDYWVHYPHYHNKIFDSRSAHHGSWCTLNGPLAATMVVETIMELPTHGYRSNKGIEGESYRSDDTKELKITSEFTLKRGDRKLYIKTEVDNTIKDHRLRLILPTGIDTNESVAGGHFSVEKRPVDPKRSDDGTFYPDMQTLPMQQFVDLSDKQHGISVLTDSFTEYEALRDKQHSIAFTLLRSVENRICTEFRASGYFPEQEGGQSLRKLEYHYALYPHAGDYEKAKTVLAAQQFNNKPFYYLVAPGHKGHLPNTSRLFSIDSDTLIMTACQKGNRDNSFIIRIYNPSESTQNGIISCYKNIKQAFETKLTGERISEIPVDKDVLKIRLNKCKIATYECVI